MIGPRFRGAGPGDAIPQRRDWDTPAREGGTPILHAARLQSVGGLPAKLRPCKILLDSACTLC